MCVLSQQLHDASLLGGRAAAAHDGRALAGQLYELMLVVPQTHLQHRPAHTPEATVGPNGLLPTHGLVLPCDSQCVAALTLSQHFFRLITVASTAAMRAVTAKTADLQKQPDKYTQLWKPFVQQQEKQPHSGPGTSPTSREMGRQTDRHMLGQRPASPPGSPQI